MKTRLPPEVYHYLKDVAKQMVFNTIDDPQITRKKKLKVYRRTLREMVRRAKNEHH